MLHTGSKERTLNDPAYCLRQAAGVFSLQNA